jgi:hypothetical protein
MRNAKNDVQKPYTAISFNKKILLIIRMKRKATLSIISNTVQFITVNLKI